ETLNSFRQASDVPSEDLQDPDREDIPMVFRLSVLAESIDAESRSFQARGATPELPREELERIARDLEAGAVARFYRGGPPQGRVMTARSTTDGLWMRIRIRSRDPEIWR